MNAEQTKQQIEIQKAEQVLPMWKIVVSQFCEHKAAVAGLIIIIFYVLIAVGAPLISKITGLDPEKQNPLARYQPMFSHLEISSGDKDELSNSFAEKNPDLVQSITTELTQKNLFTPSSPETAFNEFMQLEHSELERIYAQLETPSKERAFELTKNFKTYHVFGTDELGRDVLIRLVYGTRVSMGVGVLVTIASAIIGLLIGSFAGYHGGFVDTALMRVTDALLSLPTIPILIVVAAIDLDKLPAFRYIITTENEAIFKLVVILVLFSWMQVARLVRASVLSLREREFILAAKTMGATDMTIIMKHLLPNVVAPLLVSVTLGVGSSILYEAALSFLGLGIQPPTPSWGNMLFNAQDLITEAPFLAILPGLQILLVVMSFNYLGDGLQDAIDPKSIRR